MAAVTIIITSARQLVCALTKLTAMTSFFKPHTSPGQLLYQSPDDTTLGIVTFRSLEPDSDIDFLHEWVNLPYSKKFWQLDGSLSNLYSLYQDILNNPNAHSFIGLLNDKPVCQVDLYKISEDEVKQHIDHKPNDCGFHLLMQPPSQMIKGISVCMLRHFIRFYFSHTDAENLFGEPDKENVHANRLAVKAGLHFQKIITLSYKNANLYSITKQQFHATYPII